MIVQTPPTTAHCRRAIAPVCDPQTPGTSVLVIAGAPPPSVDGGMIFLHKGDQLDVGIDWSAWLANNNATLKTSQWAADPDSPASPTITANGIDSDAGHAIAIVDARAAVVGDTYWLHNTITVADKGGSSGAYAYPDRTLKRCIHVRVVQ